MEGNSEHVPVQRALGRGLPGKESRPHWENGHSSFPPSSDCFSPNWLWVSLKNVHTYTQNFSCNFKGCGLPEIHPWTLNRLRDPEI